MEISEIMSDLNRSDQYPAIVTDGSLTVDYFNKKAESLIPGLRAGAAIDELLSFCDRDEYDGLACPMTDTVYCGGDEYFCTVCPIKSGIDAGYVIIIAPSADADQYLSMKAAVLSEFYGREKDSPAGMRFEACLRLAAAIGKKNTSAVDARAMLGDALNYYCRLKYGDTVRQRFEIRGDDVVVMTTGGAAASVLLFPVCLQLSSNGFCSLTAVYDDNTMSVRFEFDPCKKLRGNLSLFGACRRAFYRTLGRESAELYFISRLTDGFDVGFDEEKGKAFITINLKCGRYNKLKAHSEDFICVCRAAADYMAEILAV